MRIGIFGDSFADRNLQHYNNVAWFSYLRPHHDITVHGECGSSILYSAKKILEQCQEYDLVIWCLTGAWRHTLEIGSKKIFIHNYDLEYDREFSDLVNIIKEFKNKIESRQDQILIGQCIHGHVSNTAKNIMTISCSPEILDNATSMYTMSEIELQYFLPDQTLYEIFSDYQDLRPCHLSLTNNKIFGNYVLERLRPGILDIDYSIVQRPTQSINQLLQPWKTNDF
jgi:hypothetical protein